jgi:hypothetical protein
VHSDQSLLGAVGEFVPEHGKEFLAAGPALARGGGGVQGEEEFLSG